MSSHHPMIQGFMAASHFKSTSAFQTEPQRKAQERLVDTDPEDKDNASEVQAASSISRDLNGWADRLHSAADEAGDEGLLALESSLLDIRDEIAESATLLG